MFEIYTHALGFKKIVLFSIFGYKVRIHYWPTGKVGCIPEIHDHRWSFIAIPLLGKFVEKRYKRIKGSFYLLQHYSYTKEYGNIGRRNIHKKIIKKENIKKCYKRIRKALIPYYCPVGTIHSVMPPDDKKVITLVITSRPKNNYAKIWIKNENDKFKTR